MVPNIGSWVEGGCKAGRVVRYQVKFRQLVLGVWRYISEFASQSLFVLFAGSRNVFAQLASLRLRCEGILGSGDLLNGEFN